MSHDHQSAPFSGQESPSRQAASAVDPHGAPRQNAGAVEAGDTRPQTASAATGLPLPDDDSRAHSARVAAHLRTRIDASGGWLSFADFMADALYAPGLGYYAAGSRKFAADGDFVTAPELTPLFGATLAGPVGRVLHETGSLEVLEFGAGTGALAEALLEALADQGLEVRYSILEVSADLRERQQTRLARFGDRVHWLDALPHGFVGCAVANEVLDAMPVHLVRRSEDGALQERGVVREGDAFAWQDRPAAPALAAMAEDRLPPLPGYLSEINLQAEAFVQGAGTWLAHGALLLIDYGFPRHEYYHPQRAEGTLMCHLRHVAHADALAWPGIQDITAHVDFTAMADAALEGELDVLGYTAQGRYLLNAGLSGHLQALQARDATAYARSLNAVQKLVSEAEMGELFKVLAVGKGLDEMPGFEIGDRLDRL